MTIDIDEYISDHPEASLQDLVQLCWEDGVDVQSCLKIVRNREQLNLPDALHVVLENDAWRTWFSKQIKEDASFRRTAQNYFKYYEDDELKACLPDF